jgi:hypothetical protein
VGGGGAAGVGAVMGNGDGAEVGWALDVSLGNRRRAGGAFGSVVQNVLEYVNRRRDIISTENWLDTQNWINITTHASCSRRVHSNEKKARLLDSNGFIY